MSSEGVGTAVTSERLAALLDLEPAQWTARHEPIGNGQVADCQRWEFRHEHSVVSVIVKSPSRDAVSRATANAQHLYEREVSFYRELRPQVKVRTPVPRHVEFNPATDDFLLVLEDLTPTAVVDQFSGMSLSQAQLALRELAGLHGPTARRTDLFEQPWLGGVAQKLAPLYRAIVPDLFDQFLVRYDNDVDDDIRGTVRTLRERLSEFSDFTPAVTCVVHGDFRSENLLFDGRSGDVPLAVVDWQTLSVGSPLLDVAYLLTTSLSVGDRAAHDRELLRFYLEQLAAMGVTISWDDACHEFARYTLQPIVMLVAASVLVERTERGDAMFLTMIRRAVDAVAAWHGLAELD